MFSFICLYNLLVNHTGKSAIWSSVIVLGRSWWHSVVKMYSCRRSQEHFIDRMIRWEFSDSFPLFLLYLLSELPHAHIYTHFRSHFYRNSWLLSLFWFLCVAPKIRSVLIANKFRLDPNWQLMFGTIWMAHLLYNCCRLRLRSNMKYV